MLKFPFVVNLFKTLEKRRYLHFLSILFLMLLASVAEAVSVGAIIPFVTALLNPESLLKIDLVQFFLSLSDIDAETLPRYIFILFLSLIIFSLFVRMTLFYLSTKFSFAIGADLGKRIMEIVLSQNYLTHISRNSSEVIDAIINKTSGCAGVINSVLSIFSSILLMISILVVLLGINFEVTIYLFSSFSLIYIIVIRAIKNTLRANSQIIAKDANSKIQIVQESLGSIRDTIINGTQRYYTKIFRRYDLKIRGAQAQNAFLAQSPKFIVESLAMLIMISIAFISRESISNVTDTIALIGVYAFAAQKLLPAFQLTYASIASIRGGEFSVKEVLKLLDSENKIRQNSEYFPIKEFSFNEKISFKDISFKYPNSDRLTLKKISIEINKNDCIGFIGETGAGKSTLLDIVMGLLTPKDGLIYIDNEPANEETLFAFRSSISHVSQNLYLSDQTILENIALGVNRESIELPLAIKAAKNAQIFEFINQLPEKFNTKVGEFGEKLSGGQKQRIAIARALYLNKNILILDEATSALDSDTEKKIIKNILSSKKNITILMITHRVDSLSCCNRIYKLFSYDKISEINFNEVKYSKK